MLWIYVQWVIKNERCNLQEWMIKVFFFIISNKYPFLFRSDLSDKFISIQIVVLRIENFLLNQKIFIGGGFISFFFFIFCDRISVLISKFMNFYLILQLSSKETFKLLYFENLWIFYTYFEIKKNCSQKSIFFTVCKKKSVLDTFVT